mgnify:CR=1 FL=1|tara:strand:+ start:3383 stop:4405 length:1023 start_codon:yes stop_codon:yes gene_type:complete
MSYVRALLAKDRKEQSEALQKQVAKKSLWGSIGRTAGSLTAMFVSGGTLNPITMGALSGGLSFLGGAAGSRAAGEIEESNLYGDEAKELQSQLGAFGSENLMTSLKTGITSGLGQAKKLHSAGKALQAKGTASAAEIAKAKSGVGFGEAFKDSFAGKLPSRYQAGKEAIAEVMYPVKEAGKLKDLNKLQETTKYKGGDDLYSMFEAGMDDPKLAVGYDQAADEMSIVNLDKYEESLAHSSELATHDPMLYDTKAVPSVYDRGVSSELMTNDPVLFDTKASPFTYEEGLRSSPVDDLSMWPITEKPVYIDPSNTIRKLQSQANPLNLGLSARNIYNKKWGK